jgi:hypothetical protein
MNSEEVRQLGALSDLFEEALSLCAPSSVAILGIAGGNGLDRVDPAVTKRIVGVDLNPKYLDQVRSRYATKRDLELHCADLAEDRLRIPPTELVHAALIFEHAGLGRCLDNALSLIAPGGGLSVVLQLPSESASNVSTTPFPSLQQLTSHFSLIDRDGLCDTLAQRGFGLEHEGFRPLPGGKGFWLGVFRRSAGPESATAQ